MPLRLAKAHHHIHQKKTGRGTGLGELPEIWGFAFNISATADTSEFKFGTQLGFAKTHHKITPRGKSECGLGLGELPKSLCSTIIFLQRVGLPTSNMAFSWGLPRPTIKSLAKERIGVAVGQGSSPEFGVSL